MKTRAMPAHASFTPIQRMPVPLKVSCVLSPVSIESRALPPLWLATVDVVVNQLPVNTTAGSVPPMRVLVPPGVGVGVGVGGALPVGVAVGVPVAVSVGVGVGVGALAPRTVMPSIQIQLPIERGPWVPRTLIVMWWVP